LSESQTMDQKVDDRGEYESDDDDDDDDDCGISSDSSGADSFEVIPMPDCYKCKIADGNIHNT
jgi:hypothetical protein